MFRADAVFPHQAVQRDARRYRQPARRHAHVEAVAGNGGADGVRLPAHSRASSSVWPEIDA